MIQLDLLMEAMRRQGIPVETARAPQKIGLGDGDTFGQVKKAMAMRNEGKAVILE